MRRQWKFYVSGLCLALAVPVLAATFEVETINPFSSVETSVRGINNDGSMVGDFADATLEAAGSELGFLANEANYKKIKVPGARDTDANGINNDGDVVGTFDDASGDHGYVLDEYGVHKLPKPPAAFDIYPDFNAINNDGDVVGVVTPVAFGGNKGFLLSEGHYHILDCGKYATEANGINDDGDIVGECTDIGNVEHAFLLHEGNYHIFDVPFTGASGTVALGINNACIIVGTYSDANGDHGFAVVGLLEGHPKFTSIDFPGATDTKVAAVNDTGEIVGSYTDSLGVDKGFHIEVEQ